MNKFYAFVKNMNDSLFTRFLDIIHINRLPTLLNDLASPLQIKLYMYVFGILKHDHVSFQILTRHFYSLEDFGTKPLINTLLILPSLSFINPNFFLGHPFGFSTYQVRTSDLPLGFLEAYAWCLSLSQCRALRYL